MRLPMRILRYGGGNRSVWKVTSWVWALADGIVQTLMSIRIGCCVEPPLPWTSEEVRSLRIQM